MTNVTSMFGASTTLDSFNDSVGNYIHSYAPISEASSMALGSAVAAGEIHDEDASAIQGMFVQCRDLIDILNMRFAGADLGIRLVKGAGIYTYLLALYHTDMETPPLRVTLALVKNGIAGRNTNLKLKSIHYENPTITYIYRQLNDWLIDANKQGRWDMSTSTVDMGGVDMLTHTAILNTELGGYQLTANIHMLDD